MRNRGRWIKIVAVALAFMMLLPVIALLISAASEEGALGPALGVVALTIRPSTALWG